MLWGGLNSGLMGGHPNKVSGREYFNTDKHYIRSLI